MRLSLSLPNLITDEGWKGEEKKRKKRERDACSKEQEWWVKEGGKGNYSRESWKTTAKGWHTRKFLDERKKTNLRKRCFRRDQRVHNEICMIIL